MDLIRVFFSSQNSTLIDSIPEPFPAGSLSAQLVGGNIQISRPQSAYTFVDVPWQTIGNQAGEAFASVADCLAYLVVELAKERAVSFVFDGALSDTWTIAHGLGFRPNVQVHDTAGDMLLADCQHLDVNTLVVSFDLPVAGVAYLS